MRRKQRDAKKYGKALQTERRLDKEKRKHDDLAEITKWRKNKPAGEADRSCSRVYPLLRAPALTCYKSLPFSVPPKLPLRVDMHIKVLHIQGTQTYAHVC